MTELSFVDIVLESVFHVCLLIILLLPVYTALLNCLMISHAAVIFIDSSRVFDRNALGIS